MCAGVMYTRASQGRHTYMLLRDMYMHASGEGETNTHTSFLGGRRTLMLLRWEMYMHDSQGRRTRMILSAQLSQFCS